MFYVHLSQTVSQSFLCDEPYAAVMSAKLDTMMAGFQVNAITTRDKVIEIAQHCTSSFSLVYGEGTA